MKNLITALVMLFTFSTGTATPSIANASIFSAEQRPQEWCLAQNIYYESRSSNFADMVSVADVVLNRVNDERYPDSICEVVQQGPIGSNGLPKRNQCQFSWYCDGKSDYPTNKDAWVKAQQIAHNMVTYNDYRGITEGATHYHATYVSPKWARDLQLIGRIGEHIFYRWK